jgi:hypothetical protein
MTQLQRGEGIDCPEFNMADLTPAYIYASRIGASFVRHFPVLPMEVGLDDPSPWFRLSRDRRQVEMRDITAGRAGYVAGADSQLEIQLDRPADMENCMMLDVSVVVAASRADEVQLFFRPRGQAGFTEANSRSLPLPAGAAPKTVRFRLESATGFEDTLRLDPVRNPQAFALPEVEVRCRLGYSTRPFFTLAQPPLTSQVIDSAWLDPVPGDPHAYRASSDSQVTFRTSMWQQMAECSVLHVQAKLAVQREGQAQVYFMARGAQTFTEAQSKLLAVAPSPDGQALPLLFRLESPSGFEDKLRFDPVDSAQNVRISDVQVSCRRRVSGQGAKAVPAAGPEKPARS